MRHGLDEIEKARVRVARENRHFRVRVLPVGQVQLPFVVTHRDGVCISHDAALYAVADALNQVQRPIPHVAREHQ